MVNEEEEEGAQRGGKKAGTTHLGDTLLLLTINHTVVGRVRVQFRALGHSLQAVVNLVCGARTHTRAQGHTQTRIRGESKPLAPLISARLEFERAKTGNRSEKRLSELTFVSIGLADCETLVVVVQTAVEAEGDDQFAYFFVLVRRFGHIVDAVEWMRIRDQK